MQMETALLIPQLTAEVIAQMIAEENDQMIARKIAEENVFQSASMLDQYRLLSYPHHH